MENKLNEGKFVLFYTISFQDGDDAELQILHFGNYYDCKAVQDLNLPISYTGNRPIKETRTMIVPEEILKEALKLAEEFRKNKS